MNRPQIVCLCGSTRFSEEYRKLNLELTLQGQIVLSIGCDMRSDADIFSDRTSEELQIIKCKLDALHMHKIMLADYIMVINPGGYIGESTWREIEFALMCNKPVMYTNDKERIVPEQ